MASCKVINVCESRGWRERSAEGCHLRTFSCQVRLPRLGLDSEAKEYLNILPGRFPDSETRPRFSYLELAAEASPFPFPSRYLSPFFTSHLASETHLFPSP